MSAARSPRGGRSRRDAPTNAGTTRAADALVLRPMEPGDLDTVMAIEAACYPFPWTRGNFVDSLRAGYAARLLCDAPGDTLGYFVAMPGVDEMHLLNVTVAPGAQGQGHASRLLSALRAICREERAAQLWLEVRQSNDRAQAVYRHLGFAAIGVRKGYYPASFGRREDAVVMSLAIPIDDDPERGGDALV